MDKSVKQKRPPTTKYDKQIHIIIMILLFIQYLFKKKKRFNFEGV